ncbi:MAG TPA: type I polyketide synthase [Actinocrinis sp.]|uniref:type I polyketide synthase n=1 Tax=Actinocrinis sp. TaxID=1920516 RepID=UPI002DDCBB2D|nr:type I polyketide synthase [Actinocrinis sp.]HEV2342592.1 type I polyketide synthase [Actinocrinis sp.]
MTTAMSPEPADIDARVAVVGMAVRFPGASTPADFWRNLIAGAESITRLPVAEAASYVPACGLLDDPDCFDAALFGYAPRDALIIDPQHRVFLECVWEALEHAGYDPARYPGKVGVYAGGSQTGYAELLRARRDSPLLADVDDFELRLGSGIDFLTTRASYKLGLRGPAVTVQTACSTSLVAIHLAGQALLAGECDLALAGGVTVHVPAYFGTFSESGILSADGYCRAFDAAADGTVGGDGAGVVALKRLPDALADGDSIHAVILGSAINNDGADKIGYTAPSVTGQADAVSTALRLAGVGSETIGYVEAHGTGTPLGDPIEIAALDAAFRAARGAGPGPDAGCRIGSVKTNIGHTDAAAGVAGFIKAVLALEHRALPPSLHFERPNPKIGFASTPFEVNDVLCEWTGPTPLRAGVNSLGIGGTNAHVVLEEAPVPEPPRRTRTWRLVPLTARSRSALDAVAADLAGELAAEPGTQLADLAWTLQIGRRHREVRSFVVTDDTGSLASALADCGRRVTTARPERRPTAFVFPGQGGQYVGMTRQLYAHEPVLRAHVDECARLFTPALGADLRNLLYAEPGDALAAERLQAMTLAQACVFTVEYALARLWERWGVVPDAVAGHSLGAYAAACVAGIFDLPDAVALVAARGRLLQDLPPGAMIAVTLPEAEVRGILAPGLSVAAVNGPDQCVVSGPQDAVARLAESLEQHGVEVRRLHITAAAHSALVDSAVPAFNDAVAALRLNPPTLPVVSDHTGTWLSAHEACDPAYWAAHLRGTVRFGEALGTLLAGGERHALVEVGPGGTLVSLARRHPAYARTDLLLTSLPHAAADEPEHARLLDTAGQIWSSGHDLDWEALNEGERHRRVPLPTYPFQRLRFRVDPDPTVPVAIEPVAPRDADDEDDEYTPPRGATERAVAAAFERVLGTTRVGARDSFLDLGGDSLIAARLTAWIRAEYGVAATVRQVFKTPVVEALAALIETHAAAGTPSAPGTLLETDDVR